MSEELKKGPEWAEMEERHKREGVSYFHVDRAPGATDEQVAECFNRLAKRMAIPEFSIASRLRGEAMLLDDAAHCVLNAHRLNKTTGEFEKIALSKSDEAAARSKHQLSQLLISAAELLEMHGDNTRTGGTHDAG